MDNCSLQYTLQKHRDGHRLDNTMAVISWLIIINVKPMGVRTRGKWGQLTPWKNGWKIKNQKHAKKSSFLCLRYILRAIRAGRCRERRYAGHIFIQIFFRMHHFVVKFSKFSSPQAARGHWPPDQNPADVSVITDTVHSCNDVIQEPDLQNTLRQS